MCLVLTLPKENFIECNRDSRAAQITHEERGRTLLWGLRGPAEEHYYRIIDLQNKIDGT